MLPADCTVFRGSLFLRDMRRELSELEERSFRNCRAASGELSGSDSERALCERHIPDIVELRPLAIAKDMMGTGAAGGVGKAKPLLMSDNLISF